MWVVQYEKRAVKDLKKLNKDTQQRILNGINNKLVSAPIATGTKLNGDLANYYRLRVGKYRVVYMLDVENQKISIILIALRNTVYLRLGRL
ncbi:MAG: type II toxin-antitoxin system RelE/ParE family toxin [Alphaproteobacteria bacterium]|nr:type II toxin-antitoxin system RelE/ParE family toxin [Alphaproteobacteria bacterium]MBE8220723.1 type II toxin-antitoxin system RelE/ParE family toxin [Alphaproteobacteria bacterium]